MFLTKKFNDEIKEIIQKSKGFNLPDYSNPKIQRSIISYHFKEKMKSTNIERYGVDNAMKLEETKEAARKVWNKQLGKVVVEGGTEEQIKTFYSCLFRASVFSRKFYEEKADGTPYYFSPYDVKLHDGYLYTDTGFWDTFRAQFPLNALLSPEMHGRLIWLNTWLLKSPVVFTSTLTRRLQPPCMSHSITRLT